MVTTEKILKQWEKDPIRFKAEIERLIDDVWREYERRNISPSIYDQYKFGTPEWNQAHEKELDFYKLLARITKMRTSLIVKEIEMRHPKRTLKAKIIPINVNI